MDNVSENVRNEKRTEKKDVTLSEGWTFDYKIPDLTYENFLLDTNGLVEGSSKAPKKLPVQTIFGPKLETRLSKEHKQKRDRRLGNERENAHLQAARRNRGNRQGGSL